MADYTLTVYGDDDATVLFEVGTAAAHAHPYLKNPSGGKSAEVDVVRGTASIGQQDVEVIDPQTGATQADRYLTALLGDAAGNSALNGRRAVLSQVSPAVVLLDGVIAGVSLLSSFAAYKISLRDIRERGVKVRVFTQGGTSTVLPRGVVDGYGRLPATLFGPVSWLVLPTIPLTGTYDGDASGGLILLDGAPAKPGAQVDASLVVTQAMQDAMRMSGSPLHFDQVEVWWRASGAGAWVEAQKLKDIRAPKGQAVLTPQGYTQYGELVRTSRAKVKNTDGTTTEVLAAKAIVVDNASGGTLPTDGQAVEVAIVYTGEPSDQYPFHYEGTWGEFVRNLLRGDYGASDEAGNQVALRFRYDEAALLAIDTPIRVRLTETRDDLRAVLEDLCVMIGAALGVDEQGRIAILRGEIPDASESLAQIDDTNATALAGWEHPTTSAVTQVTVTYPRDRSVSAERDPNGDRSAGDGITSDDVTILQRAPNAVLSLMGIRDLKIDAWAFRALGNRDGEPISGDVTDETGAQIAQARQHLAIDRFAYGGVSSACRVLVSDFPGLKLGDWVIDARSWRPNYATGKRGGNSLAQVVSLKQSDPAWYDVRLLDAAPSDNPASQPTLGSITADTDGIVSVPVSALPSGISARVDYALSETTPTTNAGDWTFLGRTDATGTLTSPAFPVGATVWVRARGEAVGVRPSAWTTPVSVVVPDVPRLLATSLVLSDTGVPTAGWDVNPAALGMRLYYEVHDADATPTLATYFDVDASVGAATIPGSAGAGQAVTVEFEAYTGWTGSAVSGTAGDRVRRVAVRPPADEVVPESDYAVALREVGRTNATVTFDGAWGSLVDEVRVFEALVAQPITLDQWPDITGDPSQGPFVAGSEIDFLIPPQGYARLVLVVPIDADGFAGPIERITILPTGTEPDLVTGLSALIDDSDGSVTIRVDVADRTTSIRYAYAVGASPSWPADATVEAGTVVALTGSTTISLAAGTVSDGEAIRVRAVAYVNSDGTGKDGATDHGPIVGAEDVRRVTTAAVQAIADAAAAGAADGKVTTFYQGGAPTAEGVGDLWIDTDDANKLYRWDGSAWVLVRDAGIQQAISDAATAQTTADGKIVSFFQTTTPTADGVGDFWVDTDDSNKLYRWDGSAWVSVRDGTISIAQATADSKIKTFYQTTAPTATTVGDLWIDTDDNNHAYRWDGSSWVSVRDGSIPSISGLSATIRSATAPTTRTGGAALVQGDQWIETDNGNKPYIWSGSAWTEAYTSIDGGSIKTGAIQSTIYTAGSAGWQIDFDGSAEFNNVTVRGTIESSTIRLATGGGGSFVFEHGGVDFATMAAFDGSGTGEGQYINISGTVHIGTGLKVISGGAVVSAGLSSVLGGIYVEQDAEFFTNNLKLGSKTGGAIAFYGATPATKPTVSGSKGGNAALDSLVTALATLGLVTNSTT